MKHTFFLLILFLLRIQTYAQNGGEQVLIFRNTGEVNIFYSNRLDSITLSHLDADSIAHEKVVSQIFHSQDTTMFIPISEIDSVTFGTRNTEEFHPDIHRISTTETQWIIRYDGNYIYYEPSTPTNILPKKGEKIFCGQQDGLFPMGLAAKVESVTFTNNEYVVCIKDVDLSEIFSRLFYAGPIRMERPKTRAPLWNDEVSFDFPIGENANIAGKNEVDIQGNIVANPLKGYYSFNVVVTNTQEVSLTAKIDDEATVEEEMRLITVPLGVYAFVFTPEAVLSGFGEISAELSANMRMNRSTQYTVNYVRRPGEEPTFQITNTGGADEGTKSQLDITCKGNVYLGAMLTFDFNILRETTGARLKVKAGPMIESEFGLGVLTQTATYSPEVYGKATLNSNVTIQSIGTVYTRTLWNGEENEHQVFKNSFKFAEHTYDLFPRFFNTRAVMSPAKTERTVTTATKVNNEILQDVETGFELTDPSGQVIDSIYVAKVMSNTPSLQGISGKFLTDKYSVEKVREYSLRPVFHYANHTVRAQQVSVMSGMQIQPAIFALTNGITSILSSYPYTGSTVKDSTLYTAGGYLPIVLRDTVFSPSVKPPFMGGFIDNNSDALIGTWICTDKSTDAEFTFLADGTGSMNVHGDFYYKLNTPQSGCISLYFKNSEEFMTLYVLRLTDTELQYKLREGSKIYSLNKQF